MVTTAGPRSSPRPCALGQQGLGDVLVFLGGIIPEEDIPALLELGVRGVFGPGTATDEVVAFIRQELAAQEGS